MSTKLGAIQSADLPACAEISLNNAVHEKKSSSITATEAILLLGKTVLVELVWDDDPEPLWCFVHIAGVVLALEGIYEHPHFMVFSESRSQVYPDEMFWSDIGTLRVLERRRH